MSSRAKSDTLESPSRSIAQLVTADVLLKVAPERLINVLRLGDPAVSVDDGLQTPLSVDELAGAKVFTSADYEKYLNACRLALRQLELKPGEHAIIVNGRVRCMRFHSVPMSILVDKPNMHGG